VKNDLTKSPRIDESDRGHTSATPDSGAKRSSRATGALSSPWGKVENEFTTKYTRTQEPRRRHPSALAAASYLRRPESGSRARVVCAAQRTLDAGSGLRDHGCAMGRRVGRSLLHSGASQSPQATEHEVRSIRGLNVADRFAKTAATRCVAGSEAPSTFNAHWDIPLHAATRLKQKKQTEAYQK
jgi:hypothetical protein